jgi:FtsZ-interacting cell division protein YlmF
MAAAPRVFRPESFDEVQEFADAFRAGGVVDIVLDLTSSADERRLIDFASGLALALSGTMQRVEPRHFRLTNPSPQPPGTETAGDREPRSPRPVSGTHSAALTPSSFD